MCQKLALQNTGPIFSSLGLYRGQARKTSKTSTAVSLRWLCLVPYLTCLQKAATRAAFAFLQLHNLTTSLELDLVITQLQSMSDHR